MPQFQVRSEVITLGLKHAFTISRGTKSAAENVVVTLTADGISGYGEAAPNKRYNEDSGKVQSFINRVARNGTIKIDSLDDLLLQVSSTEKPVASASAALEMAWWDWFGKIRDQPLWKLWGVRKPQTPVTSFTIGIDEPDIMQQKVLEAEKYPVLKVKLGSSDDRQIIQSLRSVTDKPIRVDANEGWKSTDTARKMISFLAGQNIEFVEQPMPADCHSEMRELKTYSPLPLIADESFLGGENIDEIKNEFHAINIKLMKIGSLKRARLAISRAHKAGLDVMIGCMIESSLAVSAGALLSLYADIADLDGFLLIQDDPFTGLTLSDDGRVQLPHKPGLGIEEAE
jgi:L-Ala-D/L-Glu epimerase